MKMFLCTLLSTTVLLAACSDDGFPEIIEEKIATPHVGETVEVSTYASQQYTWKKQIDTLATNGESPAQKFEALEHFATQYVTNEAELTEFTAAIIDSYTNDTYIEDVTNDDKMLTHIFQAFVVERNAIESLKYFTHAYYTTVTQAYLGTYDASSDESVQAAITMQEALAKHLQ